MGGNGTMEIAPTGIAGLDDILHGGLSTGKMHLLSGTPGAGKSTFCLHFMGEGIRRGEPCLYISVAGAEDEFLTLAKASGITLDPAFFTSHAIEITAEVLEGPERRIFHTAETEPAAVINDIFAEIRRVRPKRLVIDSLSDLRLLVEDEIMYRRLVLALRQEFRDGQCTVLITNNINSQRSELDLDLETICHAVLHLEQVVLGFGPSRRRLFIQKVRGRSYRSGWHDFRIVSGGVLVFPTLIAGEHRRKVQRELQASGNKELDIMFGGGLERGSSVAIVGASGSGKTTIANQCVLAAALRGERVAVYLFDETEDSYLQRAEGLGLTVAPLVEKGLITLQHVDVAEFSVGEFTAKLRGDVEERGIGTVVVDTLNGYANAMLDERYLAVHLHELLTFLSHQGVTTLLTVEQHGIFGVQTVEVKNASYLADTLILIRFFEHRGMVRRALSVVKKRRGPHEATIRELTLTSAGIVIGAPLSDLQGVLLGASVIDG
jgi:circadian clock protein KaiC